jgi:hypothetical protein
MTRTGGMGLSAESALRGNMFIHFDNYEVQQPYKEQDLSTPSLHLKPDSLRTLLRYLQ